MRRAATDVLASPQWLTVLPQVVSRILHGNSEVHDVIETILRHVISTYPHHGFWAMASGAKSTTNRRAKRNMRVFQKAKVSARTEWTWSKSSRLT